MPIFITKSPENPAVSWADLGWQRPGLDFTDKKGFSAWRSGIYSSSKYVWGQKIGSQWWFTQENDYHAFILVYICILYYIYICKYIYIFIYIRICVYIYMYMYMYIYISLSMDAVKYRRTRGLTLLDDMGMHGLYRYTLFVRRCHPSKMFNTSAKPASFGKWFRTSFAEWTAYLLRFEPTRFPFIKHPDHSCVVRLLGMERVPKIVGYPMHIMYITVQLTTLTMASTVASHWGSLRIAGISKNSPSKGSANKWLRPSCILIVCG